MTSTVQEAPGLRSGIDLSWPTFALLAAVLSVLVILPLFWLLYYSFRNDAGGGLTLDNFVALVADPTLARAYGIAIGMAAGVGLRSCLIATPVAWLVSRTDLPGRRGSEERRMGEEVA